MTRGVEQFVCTGATTRRHARPLVSFFFDLLRKGKREETEDMALLPPPLPSESATLYNSAASFSSSQGGLPHDRDHLDVDHDTSRIAGMCQHATPGQCHAECSL